MTRVRTAIIGCGKVAHLHAKALLSLPEAEFVAVYNRTPERAETFAQTYNVQAFTDVKTMVREANVQAVVVCTTHPAHAEPSIAAAEAGAHVIIEKPLASTLADCDAIIAACKNAGVKLSVISQRRFYEPVQRVWEALKAGKIGRPILGTAFLLSWRNEAYYQADPWRGKWDAEGGGVLVNQAPHQLDLLQWFMGPIEELFGYQDNLNHPYIEVEDTAIAVLRFKNGGLGNIIVSNSQKPGLYGKVQIHGSTGASVGVQTDGGAMFVAGMSNILEPPINDLWTIPGEEHLLSEWQAQDREHFASIDPMVHYIARQNQDFLQAILEKRDPLVTGQDGRNTVEIFTAIYRSQRDGKPVKFPLDAVQGSENFDGRLKA